MTDTIEQVTATVCRIGKINGIGADDDFYGAGFSSVNALELLLELEGQFGISISDDQFIQARSVRGLAGVIAELKQEAAA